MKRLMGKTEVEDSLERLDMLTQEENLMAVARTFEVTRSVDDNVKVTKRGTPIVSISMQCFLIF
jgi:hypothetical protein